MRPVDKGDAPGTFANYGEAKGPLAERLGSYCSYCEIHISLGANLDVEHVIAKAYEPKLETEWSNFLLACKMCNSHKSAEDGLLLTHKKGPRDFDKSTYLWPDQDNTLLALKYEENGEVIPRSDQEPHIQALAHQTIGLAKLNSQDNPVSDNRFKKRKATFLKAKRYLTKYEEALGEGKRDHEAILDLAVECGFWSVWMTVFKDHPEVRRELIHRFQGTATDCFDAQTQPIARPGGKV